MGANAQTSVPVFTSGQVLTAQQQTEINTGIPVFATAVTRDAAFGGTGEKTLAEGQFAYLEDSNTTQYYDGASWQSVGVAPGLVLIKTQTIGTTVSSVEVTGAFSSTYENYKITVNGGVASTNAYLQLKLGATATNYTGGHFSALYNNGTYSGLAIDNTTSFLYAGRGDTNLLMFNVDVFSPNLAKFTIMNALQVNNAAGGFGMSVCAQESSTQFTAFTITPSTGTITGGTIRVYGYANS
jgi:hypothetical protein